MNDILIVARNNAYGLTQDTQILKGILEELGFSVGTATLRDRGLLARLTARKAASSVIHMERAFPQWYSAARKNFLIPNQERFPKRHLGRLRGIDQILAKSRHAEEVFASLGHKTTYVGFASNDRLLPDVQKDWRRCLHLAGGSTLKGTEDLIELWAAHPEWPVMELVQKAENAPKTVPANVRLHSGYMADDELRQLQNLCGFHLCPSRSEGWGHHIVEGMSCAAIVITTDAPPMNEHLDASSGVLLAHNRTEIRHLGINFYIDKQGMEFRLNELFAIPVKELEPIGRRARDHMLRQKPACKDLFAKIDFS